MLLFWLIVRFTKNQLIKKHASMIGIVLFFNLYSMAMSDSHFHLPAIWSPSVGGSIYVHKKYLYEVGDLAGRHLVRSQFFPFKRCVWSIEAAQYHFVLSFSWWSQNCSPLLLKPADAKRCRATDKARERLVKHWKIQSCVLRSIETPEDVKYNASNVI